MIGCPCLPTSRSCSCAGTSSWRRRFRVLPSLSMPWLIRRCCVLRSRFKSKCVSLRMCVHALCVCVCLCACTCVYVYVHAHVYVIVFAYVHVYLHNWMCACVFAFSSGCRRCSSHTKAPSLPHAQSLRPAQISDIPPGACLDVCMQLRYDGGSTETAHSRMAVFDAFASLRQGSFALSLFPGSLSKVCARLQLYRHVLPQLLRPSHKCGDGEVERERERVRHARTHTHTYTHIHTHTHTYTHTHTHTQMHALFSLHCFSVHSTAVRPNAPAVDGC